MELSDAMTTPISSTTAPLIIIKIPAVPGIHVPLISGAASGVGVDVEVVIQGFLNYRWNYLSTTGRFMPSDEYFLKYTEGFAGTIILIDLTLKP